MRCMVGRSQLVKVQAKFYQAVFFAEASCKQSRVLAAIEDIPIESTPGLGMIFTVAATWQGSDDTTLKTCDLG